MATAIEYGLVAGLIAVVIITALTAIGTNSHETPPAVPQCHMDGHQWDSVLSGGEYVCRITDMQWKP